MYRHMYVYVCMSCMSCVCVCVVRNMQHVQGMCVLHIHTYRWCMGPTYTFLLYV